LKAGASQRDDGLDRRVTLHRDGVYEVQAFWSEPGAGPDLDAWLDHSAPFERQYGGHPLITFEPLKALYGAYLPTRVRLLAWSTVDAFDRLQQDARYRGLASRLDEATNASTITLLRMHPEIHANPDEVEVTLDDRLCYELCMFWDRPDAAAASWEAFIAAATPSIAAHGGHPLLVFQPLREVRGDFFPTRFCIAAWDSVEHFESFITAPEQSEISRLRWRAVSRMDATATRLR